MKKTILNRLDSLSIRLQGEEQFTFTMEDYFDLRRSLPALINTYRAAERRKRERESDRRQRRLF